MQLTFAIDDAKSPRIIDALKNLYAIPQVPIDPTKPHLGMKNQFTDAQWAKECVRRWIIEQVEKWEKQDAFAKVDVAKDDSVVS